MNSISKFFILIFIGFIAGCAHVYDVNYDYDKNADFANLKTYDWMTISGKSSASRRNSEYVEEAVNAELQAKDLELSSDNPDFLITARLGTKNTKSQHILGPQPSGTFTKRREHSVKTTEIEVGSIVLDFVDAKSKIIVWRGKAKAVVDDTDSPERSEKLIKKAVSKILKNFPPPK